MKLLFFLICNQILSYSDCQKWVIRLNQDFENLNEKFFDQNSYNYVTSLRIEPASKYSPKHVNEANLKFFEKFPNVEELLIWYFKMDTFDEIQQRNKIKMLELRHNEIKKLKSHQLKSLFSLEVSNLADNKIENLCENYLTNNKKLKQIWFDSNKITNIPSSFFSGLTELEGINFNSNQITFLPELLFRDNQNLNEVYFRSNKIQKLSPELFTGINLEIKYFAYNPCVSGTGDISNLENCYSEWRHSGPPKFIEIEYCKST